MYYERVHGIIAKYDDRLRSHSIIMQSQCTVKKKKYTGSYARNDFAKEVLA